MKNNILIIVVVLFLCASGCKYTGSSSENGLNSNDTVADKSESNIGTDAPASTAGSNPREEIINATKKFSEAKSFSATFSGQSVAKQPFNMNMEYISPDRYYVKNDENEIIIIGNDSYVKVKDTWNKIPMPMGDKIKDLKNSFTEQGMKSLKDADFVGDEILNGKNVSIYRYSSEIKDTPKVDSKVWVDKTSGLPMQIEVEKSEDNSPVMKITYNYEKEVKIEAPTK